MSIITLDPSSKRPPSNAGLDIIVASNFLNNADFSGGKETAPLGVHFQRTVGSPFSNNPPKKSYRIKYQGDGS
jgi:hypothetical protein